MSKTPEVTLSSHQKSKFDDLMEASYKKVYNLAYRLSNNRQDAEDLTQEAFVRAYRSFDSYQGDKPFENWILRIVTRLFLDLRRARNRRIQPVSFDAPRRFEVGEDSLVMELADDRPNPEQDLMDRTVDQKLLKALNQLRPEHRELVLMADVDELPYNEIAESAGVPIGTVRSRLHRAHRKLRELMVIPTDPCSTRQVPCGGSCACAISA